jgi:hypothetical protein
METDYGLDDRGIGVRAMVGARNVFLHVVQTSPGAHPASYIIDTGALSLVVKRRRREADHSPPTSAEVKETWVYTCTLPYAFML